MIKLTPFLASFSKTFDFNFRRNHQKKFLWASRLWVGRRKEPILAYVQKNNEKKNSGGKWLKLLIVDFISLPSLIWNYTQNGLIRPSAHRVHTTWIDKVSPSPLPHLITDPSLSHRGIHITAHTESMRFVRHSCRFMSCGLGVRSALALKNSIRLYSSANSVNTNKSRISLKSRTL